MKRSLSQSTKSLATCACLAAIVFGCLILSGCTAPIPINYSASSVMSATGTLSVAEFRYLPSEPTAARPIRSNVIRNTAFGQITIDRDVKVFVRDAVFSELRCVGIKTNDSSKILSGEIEEFLVDDLGFNIDWTLRIKYSLTNASSKKVIFQSVKNTQRKTAKLVNDDGALNETIKLNVEQLLGDASFTRAIK